VLAFFNTTYHESLPSCNSLLHIHALHFPLLTAPSFPYILLTSYPLLVTEISLSPMYLSLAAILHYLHCARSTTINHRVTNRLHRTTKGSKISVSLQGVHLNQTAVFFINTVTCKTCNTSAV